MGRRRRQAETRFLRGTSAMPNDDVILEAVRATAIVAHAGNVPLLLPVLRAQCRGLVGEPDVVIRVFRLVAIIAEDPRYRPAFDQQKSRDTISAPVTTSPSYTARNYRPRWPVIPELIRSLKARLMDLGRR